MFPSELQEAIVPRKVLFKITYNKHTEDNIATTYDSLWLFSSKEMYKKGEAVDSSYYTNAYVNEFEGELYPSQDIMKGYMIDSTSVPTINRFYNETGSANSTWSRSLTGNYSNGAVGFIIWGHSDYSYVNIMYGVAPGFCLK